MIDRAQIGRTWAPWEVEIEKGRLRLLAKAMGETRPIYTDDAAARAAGYRGIVAPLTMPYCLLADSPGGQQYLADVGIPTARMLHAEVHVEHHDLICAGDRIRVDRRLTDIVVKKGGALEFVTFESTFRHADGGGLVATVKSLMAVKNPT
ncbi:MAG: MaoC family dehydratase N-terminal domain-containing protein [Gemmatimonadales bacterium]|nr:MaoC family dehydratase N-terminal domain-containing protein [Gemmatimonadales bacterium]MDX2058076.1 MaoC family dehydratase N-terminal domain-containing protein [Gemmatimonadales bacterium]